MRLVKSATLIFLVSSCASKNPVAGRYSGLYEIAVSEKVSCHFLMKKDKLAAVPTVLCHDAEEAWAVPIVDFAGTAWLSPPLLTQSGTLIAFLENTSDEKTSVLVSTDKGRNWDIHPVFKKKNKEDKLSEVTLSKAGRLQALYKSNAAKDYKVEQDASFKSKFTPQKLIAKPYPETCFSQHNRGPEQKIPPECLLGYLSRLLK